jgi:tetratricopeptide (TPR) repeat protein
MAGSYLTASEQYPHNLGEGKLYGATENDPQPDSIFYQGLAWLKLNELYKANALFHKLIRFGEDYYHVHITIDYFAVSLPDLLVFDVDLNEKNWIHCLYLMALGNTGLNQIAEANQFFDQILSLNPAHSGAKIHQNIAQFLKKIHQ